MSWPKLALFLYPLQSLQMFWNLFCILERVIAFVTANHIICLSYFLLLLKAKGEQKQKEFPGMVWFCFLYVTRDTLLLTLAPGYRDRLLKGNS